MSVARYTLRASPAVGIGGMYATAEGLGEPVRTAALDPSLVDQQNWAMIPGSIPEDKYRVCLYNSENNFSSGWTPLGETIVPDQPLVLTDDYNRHIVWYLKKFDAPDGVANAYTLTAADPGIIGATFYAATNEQGLVVVKAIPVIPDIDPSIIPYWVLERH
ncbi:hypothetical protein PHLGIDRAFT_459549 [Phlebiopsis gigantea 11061_1 CR5-6]|uniref:Uncharacterized protein n=1 Tax=Phlebiopsis gigantea (strain 11061_1 CR5-6) TaxID=745531 RepID=A0A0C3NN36_PHLG1|nr:hypothetical protein PHLGIDRAFT_459549 [Phlebiopsis gigantea 11061_1 CR5-6]